MAVNWKYAWYIIIADTIKEDAKSTLASLKNLWIRKTVLLTGDNKKIGEKIGKELEIEWNLYWITSWWKSRKIRDIKHSKALKRKSCICRRWNKWRSCTCLCWYMNCYVMNWFRCCYWSCRYSSYEWWT